MSELLGVADRTIGYKYATPPFVMLLATNDFPNFYTFLQYLYSLQDEESFLYNVPLETPQRLLDKNKFKTLNRLGKRRRDRRRAHTVAVNIKKKKSTCYADSSKENLRAEKT